jgi:hypothetical protein
MFEVTQEKLNQWSKELWALLEDLKSDKINVIEFGKPAEITSPGVRDIFTLARIRLNNGMLTINPVHVFYGEFANCLAHNADNAEELPVFFKNVMTHVEQWTTERAARSKDFVSDFNAGLQFFGRVEQNQINMEKADI